jgi:FAD:protein FMN transferase
MNSSYFFFIILLMQEYAFRERHMGTDVAIILITESETEARKIATSTFTKIAAAEQVFSRFLPSSELFKLNTLGALTVSNQFIEVLETAIDLSYQTKGIFNPLIQIAKAGYVTDFTKIKDSVQEKQSEKYNLDLSAIKIDKLTNLVSLDLNQQLDFGGILKGYLADKLANEIMTYEKGCTGVVVNIGGDLHTQGYDAEGRLFTFNLFNPVTDSEFELPLLNTSLITSGIYKRHWQTDTGPQHHILSADGINNPDSPVVSASVIYKNGANAEAFAKYLIATDPPQIDKKTLPENLVYYLVLKDGSTINTTV